jgi:glycogen(starch) synthase
MRVLFWSELFSPYIGGNEALAAKLLPALRRRGHDFSVVTSHQSLALPDRDEQQGIAIYRFPFRAALAARSTEVITRLRRDVAGCVARIAPDLIHVSSVGPSAYFLPGSHAVGRAIPLLAHLHSEVLPSQARGSGSILARVLARAQWVVSVSAAVRGQVIDAFPSVRARSSVITNAVEEPGPRPTSLPFDPPCVLCLGRLVPEKGLDVALRVFADVCARMPEVRFVVAGDGIERTRLERQADDLGLGKRVHFLGWVRPDDVASVINQATLVLMPSRREGLPLVAIETAYMGRPVVATPLPGIAEVVIHGETGLLAAGEGVPALSRAVLDLLERPDLARRMGAAARRHARARFGLERCVEGFDQLYRRLTLVRPPALASTVPS